jgi:hypothetical protein
VERRQPSFNLLARFFLRINLLMLHPSITCPLA